eukprot:6192256-Pleurochrysis_carterae.AAC.2
MCLHVIAFSLGDVSASEGPLTTGRLIRVKRAALLEPKRTHQARASPFTGEAEAGHFIRRAVILRGALHVKSGTFHVTRETLHTTSGALCMRGASVRRVRQQVIPRHLSFGDEFLHLGLPLRSQRLHGLLDALAALLHLHATRAEAMVGTYSHDVR